MGACACAWIVDYNLSRLQCTKVKVEMVAGPDGNNDMKWSPNYTWHSVGIRL